MLDILRIQISRLAALFCLALIFVITTPDAVLAADSATPTTKSRLAAKAGKTPHARKAAKVQATKRARAAMLARKADAHKAHAKRLAATRKARHARVAKASRAAKASKPAAHHAAVPAQRPVAKLPGAAQPPVAGTPVPARLTSAVYRPTRSTAVDVQYLPPQAPPDDMPPAASGLQLVGRTVTTPAHGETGRADPERVAQTACKKNSKVYLLADCDD